MANHTMSGFHMHGLGFAEAWLQNCRASLLLYRQPSEPSWNVETCWNTVSFWISYSVLQSSTSQHSKCFVKHMQNSKFRLRFLRSWDSSRSTPASRNCKCIAITKPSDSLAHFCRKLVYAVYAKNSSSWLNRMCSWQDSHASSFTRSLSRLLPYRLHLSEKVVELLPPNLEEWSRWSKSACLSVGVFYLLHLLGDEYRKNSWDSAFTSKPCTQKKSWGKAVCTWGLANVSFCILQPLRQVPLFWSSLCGISPPPKRARCRPSIPEPEPHAILEKHTRQNSGLFHCMKHSIYSSFLNTLKTLLVDSRVLQEVCGTRWMSHVEVKKLAVLTGL